MKNKLLLFLLLTVIICMNAFATTWSSIEIKKDDLSGYVKVSNPVFSPDGNTIYIPTSTPNGHLFAVDRATGVINWVFEIPTVTYGGGAVVGNDGTIYQCGTDSKVYAINPNASQKWVFTGAGAFGAFPALSADGVLYCLANGATNSTLHAINASSGAELWNKTMTGNTGGAVVIDNAGNVYAGTNSIVAKYNAAGVLQWETAEGSLVLTERGSFAIDGTTLYAALRGTAGIAAINMANGDIKWTYGSSSDAYFPIVSPDGTIYFNEKQTNKRVYAVNPDGTLKWSTEIGANMNYGGLVLSDAGKLYGGTQAKIGTYYQVFEIDAATGDTTVLLETDQQLMAAATIGPDNRLYLGSIRASSADNFGKLFAIDINAGLETKSWSMRGKNIQGVNRIESSTSAVNNKTENNISVYTSGNQLIINNSDVTQEVYIYSCNGLLIKTLKLEHGQNMLNINRGVYILKFKSGKTQKIVV